MNTTDQIFNYSGSKFSVRGDTKRAHRTVILFKGLDLAVEYFADGAFLAATETDPAEIPQCLIKSIRASFLANIQK